MEKNKTPLYIWARLIIISATKGKKIKSMPIINGKLKGFVAIF